MPPTYQNPFPNSFPKNAVLVYQYRFLDAVQKYNQTLLNVVYSDSPKPLKEIEVLYRLSKYCKNRSQAESIVTLWLKHGCIELCSIGIHATRGYRLKP